MIPAIQPPSLQFGSNKPVITTATLGLAAAVGTAALLVELLPVKDMFTPRQPVTPTPTEPKATFCSAPEPVKPAARKAPATKDPGSCKATY